MAKTQIADIIVPSIFNKYMIENAPNKIAILACGIASTVGGVQVGEGGQTVNMPFFQDLAGSDDLLSDSVALVPGKISALADVAIVFRRGKAWSVNDLAADLAGSDPMRAVADLVLGFWDRKFQTALINVLSGAMGTANMTANVLDISGLTGGAEIISGSAFVDATQKLGDSKSKISGVLMHSATEAKLAKLDLITYEKTTDKSVEVPFYLGKRVFVDDECPVSSGTYTTYLFGQGAIGLNFGSAKVPTETDRDSLAGDDILINRQVFTMHPRGVKWQGGTMAGSSPTNAEAATIGNWTRVYDPKNIRIVQFKHKIA